MTLTMPEEVMTLTAPSASEKVGGQPATACFCFAFVRTLCHVQSSVGGEPESLLSHYTDERQTEGCLI